jgi:hypothetical protein
MNGQHCYRCTLVNHLAAYRVLFRVLFTTSEQHMRKVQNMPVMPLLTLTRMRTNYICHSDTTQRRKFATGHDISGNPLHITVDSSLSFIYPAINCLYKSTDITFIRYGTNLAHA